MYRNMQRYGKTCVLALAILLISVFSFSCATLWGDQGTSGHKKYPPYTKEPVRIAAVTKYVNHIAQDLFSYVPSESVDIKGVKVFVPKTSRIQGWSWFRKPQIEVTRGMLNIMTNEAELACLIGHEIGHKVLHGRRKSSKKEKSFKEKLETIFLSEEVEKAKWNQKREEEADEYGAVLCHKAGYDPYAFLKFFERLSHFQGGG